MCKCSTIYLLTQLPILTPNHQHSCAPDAQTISICHASPQLRRAKRKFEEKLAEGIKKDSKSFFRYVKSKVGTREKIGPLKDDSGNVLTEAWEHG